MAYRDSIKHFQERFRIISMERQMPESVTFETMSGRAYQYATADRATITLELPMESFFELIAATEEFDELESDPATTDMIKEAKIIYKLKHGTQNA